MFQLFKKQETITYLRETFPPTASTFFLISSASCFEQPSFRSFGAPSTRSFASFSPRPVIVLTSLITLILSSPPDSRTTLNSVFSSAAAAAATGAPAKATGAAAKPYFTHNNALDIDLVLRISEELPHKKIIIGGFEKVFEIGKAFRNEGIDPSHLPEHTHFEWYAAYWSYKENMEYVEKLIKNIFEKLKINI